MSTGMTGSMIEAGGSVSSSMGRTAMMSRMAALRDRIVNTIPYYSFKSTFMNTITG